MEQPKPAGKGPEIAPMVIADIQARIKKGVETYGEPLRANNGRSALQDAYEEAIDLVLYLRQMLWEQSGYTRPGRVIPVEGRSGSDVTGATDVRGVTVTTTWWDDLRDPMEAALRQPPPSILDEAKSLVHGERGTHYGHPIFDLTRTADIGTAVLRTKLRAGERLEAEDIAKMQIGTKLSRETFMPKRDNRVDTCGYAEVLDLIVQWREQNPGKDPRDCY